MQRISEAERLLASLTSRPAPTEEQHAARVAKRAAAIAPILERLGAAGVKVESLRDLMPGVTPEQARLLLRELPGIADLTIREEIVRILTQKDLRAVAFNPLVHEFRTVDDPMALYKWTVGNAIGVMATADDYEILVDLATDLAHGGGRQMIIAEGLAKMRDPRVLAVLKDLVKNDPQVARHATSALKQVEARVKRPK